jgi:hypothetical protein
MYTFRPQYPYLKQQGETLYYIIGTVQKVTTTMYIKAAWWKGEMYFELMLPVYGLGDTWEVQSYENGYSNDGESE